MKLLFQIEDQVHAFDITGEVTSQDLIVLKESLFRFFESHPSFTILNAAPAKVSAPHDAFERTLSEISTFAQARGLHFVVARTNGEAINSRKSVIEKALQKQVEMLQAKLELREKIREQAEYLVAENAQLKDTMSDQVKKLKVLNTDSGRLSPILEKLWNEK